MHLFCDLAPLPDRNEEIGAETGAEEEAEEEAEAQVESVWAVCLFVCIASSVCFCLISGQLFVCFDVICFGWGVRGFRMRLWVC